VDKRRISTAITNYLANPWLKLAARIGLPLPVVVILETVGRKSGLPRQVPVGKALVGDTLWVVTEHGRRAGYVRNIEANPRVRVRIGRRWRTGTATLMPEDDPRERQRRMPNKLNSAMVRVMHSELLTVRIDLDPVDRPGPGKPATARREAASKARHPSGEQSPGSPGPG
jgi:deazaflavin-dependent oxidoreductase (nitroreductase family)